MVASSKLKLKESSYSNNLEDLELDLLLYAVSRYYGYDFHNYAKASLKRRVANFMVNNKFNSHLTLTESLLRNVNLFQDFLRNLSVAVSEMFRDPEFYVSVRKNIMPKLKTYSYSKIWCAGCATGEEPHSLAILLQEEELLKRTTIYATDFNNSVLDIAKKGIYPADLMPKYINNYNKFGGKSTFSEYYTAKYNSIKIHDYLKSRTTFANHNLVTDKSFGEMNAIFCRNVMIYFNEELTNKVLELFRDSLCHKGFLCLGSKESLTYSSVAKDFDVVDAKMKIYRKR